MTEQKDSYQNLCFEGGGVRGFAYCGAIKQLESLGKLSQFKRFAGSSVGSLFAALLVAGFTADEIMSVKDDLNFSEMEKCCCCFSSFYNIWSKLGVHKSSKLETQISKILKKKINPKITLRELYLESGKDLVIVSCCISREKAVYFHHATFPNVQLIDALIASISVPGIFQPRKYNFLGTDDYYVDGGVVDNYPLWVFNDLKALYNGGLNKVKRCNIDPKTLGLKLFCKGEFNDFDVYEGRKQISSAIDLGVELVNTFMMQIERNEISPSYISQTVPISTGDMHFLDFDIGEKKKNYLIKSGEKSVKNYFDAQKCMQDGLNKHSDSSDNEQTPNTNFSHRKNTQPI